MNFFASLIGQNQAVELLNQAILQNRIAPGYLFAGPPGVGRRLAAQCFITQLFAHKLTVTNSAQEPQISQLKIRILQRNHPDLLWVEPTYLHQGKRLSVTEAEAAGLKRKAPPQIRIEQIREIGEFLSRPPLEASHSVVILDQAETMAESAANGLLKTLEEPGKATIILIAPAVESLLPTLVSRCQRIPFYRLNQAAMNIILQQNNQGEILAHEEVLAMAQGSPGEAINCWQKLQTIPQELLEKVKRRPQNLRDALDLAKEIDKSLDPESQLWLVDYLQHCYGQQVLQGIMHPASLQHLEKIKSYLLSYIQPRLAWECTLIELCQK